MYLPAKEVKVGDVIDLQIGLYLEVLQIQRKSVCFDGKIDAPGFCFKLSFGRHYECLEDTPIDVRDSTISLIDLILGFVDTGMSVELLSGEDHLMVWRSHHTKDYCLMLNAQVIKSTKRWHPISYKLSKFSNLKIINDDQ